MSRSDYGTPFFQRRPARTACHRSQIAIGYTSRFLDAFGIYTRQNMPIPGELKIPWKGKPLHGIQAFHRNALILYSNGGDASLEFIKYSDF